MPVRKEAVEEVVLRQGALAEMSGSFSGEVGAVCGRPSCLLEAMRVGVARPRTEEVMETPRPWKS